MLPVSCYRLHKWTITLRRLLRYRNVMRNRNKFIYVGFHNNNLTNDWTFLLRITISMDLLLTSLHSTTYEYDDALHSLGLLTASYI